MAEDENMFDEFALPEDCRIVIRGGRVTIENLTPDLLDVALALNPSDPDLLARAAELAQDKRKDDESL